MPATVLTELFTFPNNEEALCMPSAQNARHSQLCVGVASVSFSLLLLFVAGISKVVDAARSMIKNSLEVM